ncbi:hypothetical protein KAR91_85785 [Candidatus Pacearchaeota archaeon]|nr:hypothetical protein [Candidatus Pacearchaeota archaeon]
MKKVLFSILGVILLFPIYISDALGIDIDTFRDEVFRPENLPVATGNKNLTADAKINSLLLYVVDLILYASGGAAVLFLVIGGIRYISSFGDQERMDGAKKTIKYAVIGLLAVILSFAIVTNVIDLIFKATI